MNSQVFSDQLVTSTAGFPSQVGKESAIIGGKHPE